MIQIAYPWILIVFFLPFLLRYFLTRATTNNAALKVPFISDLINIFNHNRLDAGQKILSKLKYFIFLIWLLIVISASGIQWLGKPVLIPQLGRDLMLAVDLSGSMRTPDMIIDGKSYTRIAVVKDVGSKFINQRSGDRVGLILFGSKPYLQTPLTFDRQTVKEMLNDATIGLAGEQTAIGDAIALAVKQLISYPSTSKALILLTDGGNNTGVFDPIDAAKLAQKEHIKIYTIGLGAKQLTIQTMFGPQVINPSSDLDIDSLRQIAQITGGQFFRAEDGNELQNIYTKINSLEPVKSDSATVRPKTLLYPWTLSLALLLSFILIAINIRMGLNHVR
ncbi:MAG: VWA domain-containing protein [Burkholderiales bacterium]|nr:VWA domain-containing protein [Burkholderiales bacterium]